MVLDIDPIGQIRCLYGEAIDLTELGALSICRASYVEPDRHAKWHVDLSPVNGPVLGPYLYRQSALDAEEAWLLAHWLGKPTSN